MTERKYTIGVDFGTESGRAVLVDVSTGQELATAVHWYKNGVIDQTLPESNVRLEPDWALQDPNDYIEVFKHAIPAVLEESGVDPADVIGIGIDFTACTMLPTKADGTPLCFLPEWRDKPHAWVKLWKHHAAQPEANKLNEIARRLGYHFPGSLRRQDQLRMVLPQSLADPRRSAGGVCGCRPPDRGSRLGGLAIDGSGNAQRVHGRLQGHLVENGRLPAGQVLQALDPRLERIVDEKMKRDILPLGAKAGGLTEAGCRAGPA